jgi:hypothetical protein
MVALVVKNFLQKVLVVGPIYDKIEAVQSQQKILNEQDLIIFNGNLCYPNNNLEEVEARIKIMEKFIQTGKVIYNLGNQDLLLMKQLDENNQNYRIVNWLKTKSNVVMVDLLAQSGLIITNGGVTPEMKRSDLDDDLETSFVSNIKNEPWHRWYGGGYGYIISNNPLTRESPKFYNFSMQIGNIYDEKNQTYAVQIGQYGVERIFSL